MYVERVTRGGAAPAESKVVEDSVGADRAAGPVTKISTAPNIIVIDVSFISLRDVLPHIHDNLSDKHTQIIAMLKPQFEAGKNQTNKGIIKNEAMRRKILHDFESWVRQYFIIESKRDSEVSGAKGNRERFYLLKH
jgi:23S rRNA (cytidine1920-2'-O)/16S rRNA (cytidine1409-2'-O)-methyltransferase